MTDSERLDKLERWLVDGPLNIDRSLIDGTIAVSLIEDEDSTPLLGEGPDLRDAIDAMPECDDEGSE